jgi:transcriptional regulator with XRE-family HTH domain
MIHFNNSKLKERIKASGLKSNYIADSLGLHKQTISFYLTGRRTPKKETLKEIAKLCRCKLGDFYDTKEEAEAREHQNNS